MSQQVVITNVAQIVPKLVCGEKISILANSDQTGSYEIYLHDAPEGAGPPPHCHEWDEAFYVIQGAVDFNCGGIASTVTAGGFVHVAGGTVHSFRYASPTAQILGITSKGGAAKMFTAVDSECGTTPAIDKLIHVLGSNGVNVAA
jgi:quercetin dioxygenase-like cupin family protein